VWAVRSPAHGSRSRRNIRLERQESESRWEQGCPG